MAEEDIKILQIPIYSNIAYDDAFRTMEGECDDILIPFVNYFFGEEYDSSAVISRMRNEHFIEHEDHSEEKRITDSHFSIAQNGISKKYHLECESSNYDGSLLVRLFEYGSQIAVDEAYGDLNELRVRIPITGLLLLRESPKAPNKAKIIIETPEGETSYHVSILKESDFTIDKIFEKDLFFLIPFYIFNYERELQAINDDEQKIDSLLEMYKDIYARLENAQKEGRLSSKSFGVIIGLTHSVFSKITSRYKAVYKKVGDFMGGKVLDLPEVMFYKMGIMEGEERIKKVQAENEVLQAENDELQSKFEGAQAENDELRKKLEILEKELELR